MNSKPRLLVIDDEPRVGTMLSRLLSSAYQVTTATSGREGLTLVMDQDWDLILCDIMMPEMSGPEFLEQLREQAQPLINRVGFMTGGAFDPATLAFLEECGSERCLSKPFARDQLMAFLENIRVNAGETDG